jgi:hypothetical protein
MVTNVYSNILISNNAVSTIFNHFFKHAQKIPKFRYAGKLPKFIKT